MLLALLKLRLTRWRKTPRHCIPITTTRNLTSDRPLVITTEDKTLGRFTRAVHDSHSTVPRMTMLRTCRTDFLMAEYRADND